MRRRESRTRIDGVPKLEILFCILLTTGMDSLSCSQRNEEAVATRREERFRPKYPRKIRAGNFRIVCLSPARMSNPAKRLEAISNQLTATSSKPLATRFRPALPAGLHPAFTPLNPLTFLLKVSAAAHEGPTTVGGS